MYMICLTNDVSKETYEKIVRFRLIDDSTEVPTITQESQYFEKDFYRNETDACFVDCGAFNGISMETFLKINGGVFERYYGFEPDSYNFQLLNKFIDGLPLDIRKRSEIFNAAVYGECGTETFLFSQRSGKLYGGYWKRKCQYNNDRQGVGRKKSYIYQDEYRGV